MYEMDEMFSASEMEKRWARLKKEGRVPKLEDVLRTVQTVQSETEATLPLTAADQKLLKGMKISVGATPGQLELFK